jgi:hypothetical protein
LSRSRIPIKPSLFRAAVALLMPYFSSSVCASSVGLEQIHDRLPSAADGRLCGYAFGRGRGDRRAELFKGDARSSSDRGSAPDALSVLVDRDFACVLSLGEDIDHFGGILRRHFVAIENRRRGVGNSADI